MRLLELDQAIAEVRAALAELTPDVSRMCALRARHGMAFSRAVAMQGRDPYADPSQILAALPQSGPGTRLFERLITAAQSIEEQDRRALEDVGLDPDRILHALDAQLPPPTWAAQLEQTLDYVRTGIRKLPQPRYG